MSFPNSNDPPLLLPLQENERPCSLQLLELQKQNHFVEGECSKREKRPMGMSPVNNFIQKTYALLQEKKFESIVSWASNSELSPLSRAARYEQDLQQFGGRFGCNRGSSFRIHNVKAFEQVVLPQYFKHSNLSSFVRQLNMYNFHKVRGDKNEYEFEHEKFSRFRPELLCEIKRKQVESTVSIPSIGLISSPEMQAHFPENMREVVRVEKPLTVVAGSPFVSEQKVAISLQQFCESPDKKESSLKVPSNDPQSLSLKLSELQQQNRSLKKMKQSRLGLLKQLTSSNRSNLGNKFNKIIMSALTSKIKQDLSQLSLEGKGGERMGMKQLIEHIMDESPARSFEEYQRSTDGLFNGDGETKQEQ